MKVVILNPNTDAAMTQAVVAALQKRLPAAVELLALTARAGVPVIHDAASYAIGAESALALLAEVPADAAAIVLACFGDPGLATLRAATRVPVIGMVDATARVLRRDRQRYAVVTAGAAWIPLLTLALHEAGAGALLTGVYALPGHGGSLRRDPAAARGAIAELARRAADEGAERLVFGGAAFAGLDYAIDPRLQVLDALDAVAAAVLELTT